MAEMKWTREPLDYRIEHDRIEITTAPGKLMMGNNLTDY